MANLVPASLMVIRDTFRVSATIFLTFIAYAMSVALLLVLTAILFFLAYRIWVAVVELLRRTGDAMWPARASE